MQKRKSYIWLALGMTVIFLLCMGVACSDNTPSDATTKPFATAMATANGQATPEGSAQSTPQPTPIGDTATQNGNNVASQTQVPVETGDNIVTIPPAWGWGTTESDAPAVDATEPKQPNATQKPVATQEATATTNTTESTGETQTATTAATPKPTTSATPIGTDEEGWIDIWV